VFVALACDRSLAERPAKLGPDAVKNPLSGKKAKGQAHSPRAFHKQVLPEIAANLGISARTLERDDDKKEQLMFLASKFAAAIRRGDADKALEIAGQMARIRQG
jgi:hypothetical protein